MTRKGTYSTNNSTYVAIASDPEIPDFILPIFFRYATPDGKPVEGSADQRLLAFSSLSNAINNVVMQNSKSGVPLNQMRYFIVTPDQVMDQQVRDTFKEISVADKDIFTEQIPSNLNIGLGKDSDDFSPFIRYAQPNDGGAPGTALTSGEETCRS